MEIAARRLGLDPAGIRRRNLVRRADFPYRTPSGGLYDSGDYEACLDQALSLLRKAKVRLLSVTPVRMTLEQYFMQQLDSSEPSGPKGAKAFAAAGVQQ